jgi:hypothetical protein
MIVIAATQLQLHDVVSKRNGHVVNPAVKSLAAININAQSLAMTVSAHLAIRQVFSCVSVGVIK